MARGVRGRRGTSGAAARSHAAGEGARARAALACRYLIRSAHSSAFSNACSAASHSYRTPRYLYVLSSSSSSSARGAILCDILAPSTFKSRRAPFLTFRKLDALQVGFGSRMWMERASVQQCGKDALAPMSATGRLDTVLASWRQEPRLPLTRDSANAPRSTQPAGQAGPSVTRRHGSARVRSERKGQVAHERAHACRHAGIRDHPLKLGARICGAAQRARGRERAETSRQRARAEHSAGRGHRAAAPRLPFLHRM